MGIYGWDVRETSEWGMIVTPFKRCLHVLNAFLIANNSRSYTWYLCSMSLNRWLIKLHGCISPSDPLCLRTAPTAQFDTSVSNINGLTGSGMIRTGSSKNFSFNMSNSAAESCPGLVQDWSKTGVGLEKDWTTDQSFAVLSWSQSQSWGFQENEGLVRTGPDRSLWHVTCDSDFSLVVYLHSLCLSLWPQLQSFVWPLA